MGSAVSLKKRWREHRRGLQSGKHHNQFMQRTFNARPDAFAFQVLLYCNREHLLMYEQRFLDAWKPEFNTSPTAGSQLGYRHSEETRKKMSAVNNRTGNPGHKHSDASRAQISANRKGRGCGERPPEWRANISASLKGREVPQELRARISAKLMGHKQSPEQIEKRAEKLRGKLRPLKARQLASERMTGRKLPPDYCQNIGRSKAKLSDQQVREIRLRSAGGELRKTLAADFAIDPACITHIVSGKSYRWVD